MCTRYPIINRVSELKVHIELTRFVQPEKIEIDANERAVNEKSQYCFFVCTTFDSFLNDLKCSQQERTIQVSIPAEIPVKDYPYNAEVELINPVADTVANANYRGADVEWYIKADDIVLKNKGGQPAGNPQGQPKK